MSRCDPDVSSQLQLLRYHLGFTSHLLEGAKRCLRGTPERLGTYGYCHVVPSLKWSGGQVQRAMAFGGATTTGHACAFSAPEAHPIASEPEVVPLQPVHC